MKKLLVSMLALTLPLSLCGPIAAADEIPDGFSFQVEIVGSYTPPPEQDNTGKTGAEDKFAFDYTLESFAKAFTAETNRIREENGLPAFETDDLLTEMAQARSDESDKLSHVRPDGTDPTTIFTEYGSILKCTGENIMSGGPTPENAARGFMTTNHRKNILNPDATYMGVGVSWVDTIVGPRISVLQLFARD